MSSSKQEDCKPQSVWYKLYVGREEKGKGQAKGVFEDVGDLRKVIKEKWGNRLVAAPPELYVFPVGTNAEEEVVDEQGKLRPGAADRSIDPGDAVPNNANNSRQRMIVVAPTPEGQPLVPQQQIPTDTLIALGNFAKEYLETHTIALSRATIAAQNDIFEMFDLVQVGADWPVKPNLCNISPFPPFQWRDGKEDSTENRKAYMSHLNENVRWPAPFALGDAQPDRSMLTVNLHGRNKRRKVSGTTDVVVSEVRHVANRATRQNIDVLLELKAPNNMATKDHRPQAVCAHIAASFLNTYHPVVTVLTDLVHSWTFYWFAKDGSLGDRVCLYTLDLTNVQQSAGLAKYILENLFDQSCSGTLPTTLLQRLRFDSILTSGQAATDNTASDRNDKPQAKRRSGTRSASELLSLFAPPSHRDVANELDLLDMVDEEEQYRIVRSFAAKYIVPRMTGRRPSYS